MVCGGSTLLSAESRCAHKLLTVPLSSPPSPPAPSPSPCSSFSFIPYSQFNPDDDCDWEPPDENSPELILTIPSPWASSLPKFRTGRRVVRKEPSSAQKLNGTRLSL